MIERLAKVCLHGWGGTLWQTVRVVGETPKRYRIAALPGQRVQVTGLRRYIEGEQTYLVPKRAVTFVDGGSA